MTMKLRASRYNLRRSDIPVAPRASVVQSVAPAPAPANQPELQPRVQVATAPPTPKPAAPAKTLDTNPEMMFDNHDDGFGMGVIANAGNQPTAAEKDAAAAMEQSLDSIRKEGLTGRQLRLARRLAQQHNLPATSDFHAVLLLRQNGIEPFQRASILDVVSAQETAAQAAAAPPAQPAGPIGAGRGLAALPGDAVKLPQTIKPIQVPSTEMRAEESHLKDLMKIQKDIVKRRRKRSILLMTRLAFFVGLPTLIAAWYFYMVATPLYATKSEFVIQQSEGQAPGLGGLFSGTQFATSQDSIAVQGYLQSRDAMTRLDKDVGFGAHFKAEGIDPLTRLAPDATLESTYKVYKKKVRIAYDPTEGIIKMEVIAADPESSAAWSRQLIGYAEEQIDHLTQRLREDQMKGAREAYERAEAAAVEAQRKVVQLQEKYKVLSSDVEVGLISSQIGALETQLTQDKLSLAQMESNENPNAARMEPLKRRIETLEGEILKLRSGLTEDSSTGSSLATVQGELLVAQADVQTRQLLLGQSLQAMETSRAEANRQTRYLSISVSPTPPDEATYPKAFENTLITLFIFLGIYLMIAMTAAILREQLTT